MIARKFDQTKLTSLLLFAMGVVGVCLANRSSFWDEDFRPRGGESLGHVERDSGLVRQKTPGSFMWRDLHDRAREIEDGDSLFTGTDGQAEVILNGSDKMTLMPSSLVVINKSKAGEPSISLQHGHLKLTKIKSGNLEFRYHGKKINVSTSTDGANFEIDGDEIESGGAIRVAANTGQLKISPQDEQFIMVEPGQKADLSTMVPPLAAAPVAVADTNATSLPSPTQSPPQPEKLATAEVQKPAASTEVVPKKNSPLFLFPVLASTRLDDSERLDRISIPLKWKPVGAADSYEVQVFRKDHSIYEKKDLQTNEINFELKSLEDTELKWQVIAHFKSQPKQESGFSPIHIDFVEPIPNPVSEKDALNPKGVTLTWQSTVFTEKYKVQISTDGHFSKILIEEEVSDNFYRFPYPNTNQKYYWRVRSQYKKFKSKWSETIGLSL